MKKVDFSQLEWQISETGVRSKSIEKDGTGLRLVELRSDLVEQEWCIKGHTGYVLEGELEIRFDNSHVRFSTGDGFFIREGRDERHKPKALTEVVQLILVEDVQD